ncbi:phospholipase A1-like [Teleopsis dalmanni]|uniref:phospholipase A1-like n=1 Tax=Teleopsis dalmanni TaxID=139649 RepID=UPI0018CE5935|nr:phospholipase A1-like [Teleopsis dalmanni]XP_037959382.1 phospholipase A1-like [Teleopsis dalmanni]
MHTSASYQCVRTYRNQQGHCDPLTVDFLAGLIAKKARELLQPDFGTRKKTVHFDLYTRLNPYVKQRLSSVDHGILMKSHFNASWPIRISIHGWNGQATTCSNAAIKDSYLAKGDFNVVLVDWSEYALNINYVRVINEIYEISQKIMKFTKFLHDTSNVKYSDMYLIGHSLGAHVAGVAGKLLKPHKYGVIYALDTSGPIHKKLNTAWRLTPSDAIYVESIQTDLMVMGFPSASLAHASFYPNWGLRQTHCPNATAMEPQFTCDHFGSLYYFAESVQNNRAFGAIRCNNFQSIMEHKCGVEYKEYNSKIFMGGEPAVPKSGIFYLSTRKNKPFGYGQAVKMKNPVQPVVMKPVD